MRIILLFVDGLGIGASNPEINPCVQKGLLHLGCYQEGNILIQSDSEAELIAVDTSLNVPGLPQSATGQVTLFTGKNASMILGRHLYGFPNQPLRELLNKYSILKVVKENGLTCDFLNTFRDPFFDLPEATQWRLSATTGATLAAGLDFHRPEDIALSRSIYHDITGKLLHDKGFDVPVLSLADAGKIVACRSRFFDLLLFEYFLTDLAGHKQEIHESREEIKKLDTFIEHVLTEVDLKETLLIVTSDHGNIEDLSTKSHTMNPALTLAWGPKKMDFTRQIRDLTDVTPALLNLLDIRDRPV